MNQSFEDRCHQENIEIILSGNVERNINIATKYVPDDTFTVMSREQFLKLIDLGVQIPLRSQTSILYQIEPQFLVAYAELARYAPEQIAKKVNNNYPIAEHIMVKTWSFWFDYLQKLMKEKAGKEESEPEVVAKGISEIHAVHDQIATENDVSETLPDSEQEQTDQGSENLSNKSLQLVEDVWAEFEKAGMDKW